MLAITLADPVIRLIRLELKYSGRQQEVILEAKTEGLESERIQAAMAARAEWEASELAERIMGNQRRLPTETPVTGFNRSKPQVTGRQNYDSHNYREDQTDPK